MFHFPGDGVLLGWPQNSKPLGERQGRTDVVRTTALAPLIKNKLLMNVAALFVLLRRPSLSHTLTRRTTIESDYDLR